MMKAERKKHERVRIENAEKEAVDEQTQKAKCQDGDRKWRFEVFASNDRLDGQTQPSLPVV
jgi:hypothetical protein